MVLGAVETVTSVWATYQCAEIERIAHGLGISLPKALQAAVYGLLSNAFIGLPCPKKIAGRIGDMSHPEPKNPCYEDTLFGTEKRARAASGSSSILTGGKWLRQKITQALARYTATVVLESLDVNLLGWKTLADFEIFLAAISRLHPLAAKQYPELLDRHRTHVDSTSLKAHILDFAHLASLMSGLQRK
jgi:hypothetical protein